MSRSLRILVVIGAVGAAFALGFLVRGGGSPAGDHAAAETPLEDAGPQWWTCSMHPTVKLPSNDQKCPICFMDLIPLSEGAGDAAKGEIALTETAAALAGVSTEPVQRRFVPRGVRLVGKIRPDETRTRRISARVGGRLDRLLVNATGQSIRSGQPMAEIFSPELYSAQAELQAAAQAIAVLDQFTRLAHDRQRG